jgi:hypothetical protein
LPARSASTGIPCWRCGLAILERFATIETAGALAGKAAAETAKAAAKTTSTETAKATTKTTPEAAAKTANPATNTAQAAAANSAESSSSKAAANPAKASAKTANPTTNTPAEPPTAAADAANPDKAARAIRELIIQGRKEHGTGQTDDPIRDAWNRRRAAVLRPRRTRPDKHGDDDEETEEITDPCQARKREHDDTPDKSR